MDLPWETIFYGEIMKDQKNGSSELTEIVKSLKTQEDLDEKGQGILDLLKEDGQRILETDPHVFTRMILRAYLLITSSYYIEIIQEMTSIYQRLEKKVGDHPLKFLLQQIYDMKAPLVSTNQDRLFTVMQVLITAEDSSQMWNDGLWALFAGSSYAPWFHFHFTDTFADTAKLFLNNGADPTLITDFHNALNKFFASVVHLLATENHLVHRVMELVTIFLSEKSVNYIDSDGTVLHSLMSNKWEWLDDCLPSDFFQQYKQVISMVVEANPALLDKTDDEGRNPLHCFFSKIPEREDVCRSVCNIVQILKSESNISTQDKSGRTILHLLVRAIFLNPALGHDVFPILPLLTTVDNVNAADVDSATPLTWVLRGKLVYEDTNFKNQDIFTKIEEIFLEKGADVSLAKAGLTSAPLKLISDELSDANCTSDRLQKLLSCLQFVTNWNSGSSNTELNKKACENMRKMYGNPEFIRHLLDIMKISVKNEDFRNQIWSGIIYYPTLTCLEVLSFCAENGVQPTERDLNEILLTSGVIKVSEDLHLPFLKTLNTLRAHTSFSFNLDFLGYCYKMDEEVLHLGRQLMHRVYKTLDDCLESQQLINCFLFLTFDDGRLVPSGESVDVVRRKLEESLLRSPPPTNWLLRSPLHLAAIFLDSKNTFDCLPESVVEQYINATDLHGCTPLHIAYLHHNLVAICFLESHCAKRDVVDNFGLTPESLGSQNGVISVNGKLEKVHYNDADSVNEHIDVRHYQLCESVMTAEAGVFEKIRPMLIIPEEEANALCEEFEKLFAHSVKMTELKGEIVMAGSLQEKLKAGRLDEADVQIRVLGGCVWQGGVSYQYRLIKSLGMISWEDIHLRPVSVKSPWKFIWERSGPYEGLTVSVDVVLVKKWQMENNMGTFMEDDFLEDRPAHTPKELSFSNFNTGNSDRWTDIRTKKIYFTETPFIYEWDIIDSLPPSYRIAIVITKALVQAYDWYKGDRKHVEMPISSYTIKAALFYIYTGYSDKPAIAAALDCISNIEADNRKKEKKRNKLKYNPNPKWISDDDLDQHVEEARMLTSKIFAFIQYFAKRNHKVKSYWNSSLEECGFGEAEFIHDICDCLLQRLQNDIFYLRHISKL